MSQSTASFIAYDLRPAKQIERRMIVDFVRGVSGCGIDLSLYHYLGMGGVRFIDFLMVHRYLGISDLTSVEQSADIIRRCDFNKPLGSIELFSGDASAYLARYTPKGPGLVWFDYDWSISNDVQNDIVTLGLKSKVGSFVFITVSGDAPRFLKDKGTDERFAYYSEELGNFCVGYSRDDFQNSMFRFTISKILLAILTFAFAHRTDATFLPLFRVIYRDSVPMISAGGVLAPPLSANVYRNAVHTGLSFFEDLEPDKFYQIDTLNLTEKERMLFDLAVTSNSVDVDRENSIKSLGFDENDLATYRNLVRFMPRYIETYL